MGGAAALELEDMAFTQYREPGILMWRDFGMQACFFFVFYSVYTREKGGVQRGGETQRQRREV